ncbi:hypothetical protein [Niastella sp. OAS944]|uniref:hypothetical protein n=1 Tax=Niastella sp. OAS944 TaxID=2664089 RepID=UPI0034783839|nr:hypothetical protein [Chitinophagaceae bacterium OAS944]
MISFEEYRKQFEIFGKIDTPEKLAICESHYKSQLLHIEAQKYFEPFEYETGNDVSSRYENNLAELLPFDKISESELSLIIKPAFEPESLLVIDKKPGKYSITYTALVTNYWYLFYQDNSITEVEKKIVAAELREEIGDKLYSLIDTAILEARKPEAGGFVLDGVVYVFSRILNGKQVSVFKHSPSEGSKTANIINVMEWLVENLETLNEASYSDLGNMIAACQDK